MDDKSCKVVVIGVYWGEFPAIFPQWLHSCERNKTIDFLVVTDNNYDNLPANVTFINMSLSNFRKLAIKKIGMEEISLKRIYKICDYKPIYGCILEDYIKEYDYWGHCDFDMIFGDIRFFGKV